MNNLLKDYKLMNNRALLVAKTTGFDSSV